MDRILWFGISPYRRTGYGVQCRVMAPLFRDLGYKVAIAQMGGPGPGDLPEFDGIPIIGPGPREYRLPRPMDIRRALGGEPDLVLVLKDAWVLPPAQFRHYRTAVWVNVDCSPMGEPDAAMFRESGARPVATSRFGLSACRAAGFKDALHVPHGIDTGFWTPGDRQEARDRLGLPRDVFVAGLNAMNLGLVPRKAFFEQFSAFAQFRNRMSPGAVLLAHTNPDAHKLPNPVDRGIDLRRLARVCGVADAVRFAGHLHQTELQMRTWYRALDVLLMATYGEGFGLPVLEAMACGVPVIGTDAAALPEKIPTGAGWLVDGQEFWNDVHGATWVVPQIRQITAQLGKAAAGRGSPEVCRSTALGYDAERIARDIWAPVLKELVTT